MIEADCPNCRFHYVGWALTSVWHQTCPNCGAKLSVALDGRKLTNDNTIPTIIEERVRDFLSFSTLPNNKNDKNQKRNKE